MTTREAATAIVVAHVQNRKLIGDAKAVGDYIAALYARISRAVEDGAGSSAERASDKISPQT